MAPTCSKLLAGVRRQDPRAIGRAISAVENNSESAADILSALDQEAIDGVLVLGITGPPGAGKSTLTSSMIRALRKEKNRVGIIAIDPSSPISGGAILGDRIRMMEHALDPDVVLRSMATRGRLGGLCASAGAAVRIMAAAGCQIIIIETVGVGQSEMDIVRLADITLMVLAPGFGDDIQAMKAGLLEVADLLIINKSDLPGAEALCMEMEQIFRDKQEKDGILRVVQTIAAQHQGIDQLLATLNALAFHLKSTGIQEERRHKALNAETLDWIFEILRPHFIKAMNTKPERKEPRIRAQELIHEFTTTEHPE
ncbi:MAG: methylmalonyl Co-A mutase-associated GTPase MeaB [Proteobacteria bacterium]|nr:methylmalonyl Co-A mutase-associated GTPase MeaB [Pseudomonadota bacterium]MBU1059774.1 methylmalonyl Co-A mutase-associated GTPase MeaB [Pseudomonadota bacterium]